MISFVQLTIAAAYVSGAVADGGGDRWEPPTVVVVGAEWCGPCRKLHDAWDAARRRGDKGYTWRRWADSYYRIRFVNYDTLPNQEKAKIGTIPAVYPPRRRDRRGGRAGPRSISVHPRHPVAFFGQFLLEQFPPVKK